MPPLKRAIPLGLQHVLAMFVGNITVLIIIAGLLGVTPEEKVWICPKTVLCGATCSGQQGPNRQVQFVEIFDEYSKSDRSCSRCRQ